MGEYSTSNYASLLSRLASLGCKNERLPDLILSFINFTKPIMETEQQDKYSEPMPWIGIYVALASIVCILAMVADLLHGLKNRKLWFPCNYFTLNAASLSVIGVAIKLPMDLSSSLRGEVDQAAKLGSMAFTCTMMANFLPSLATMDNKELLNNIIALVVLVITLVVNVCIQIKTGVVSIPKDTRDKIQNLFMMGGGGGHIDYPSSPIGYIDRNRFIALVYVAMLLVLLMIHTCSALTILRSKQILEEKYQAGHERALKDLELPGVLNVEKLNQHVRRYWIMAGTGSPQFLATCSATTTASGVICAATALLHSVTMLITYEAIKDADSDYQWSMPVIFITQYIGVVLGTIAPLSRCFASLSFNRNWIWEHINVFNAESYWTAELNDWKESSIPSPLRSRKCKVVIENSKFIILSICIGIQKTVVVVCKIMAAIPIFFMACFLFVSFCWKWLKVKLSASGHERLQQNEEPHPYVLKLEEGMEPSGRTLESISKSMDRLIKKAENQPPKKLMNLLKEFHGVEKFDNLLLEEYPKCWSLPLVTLTAIAISLPNIEHKKVNSLVRSVGEGMLYVTLVEETLNATDEYVRIQKAAKMLRLQVDVAFVEESLIATDKYARIQKAAKVLWLQVDVYHKWLGNKLKDLQSKDMDIDPQSKLATRKTSRQILKCFKELAAKICGESKGTEIERLSWKSFFRYICATSMDRITEKINQVNIDALDQEELFERLSSTISDILAVCFTNLPEVIARRCHTSVIEKMETSVYAAAQLLGETTQIINGLEDRELPSLDPDESMLHPFP